MVTTDPFPGFLSKTQESWWGTNSKHFGQTQIGWRLSAQADKRSSNLAILINLSQVEKVGMEQGECVGILHKDFWVGFSALWESNL